MATKISEDSEFTVPLKNLISIIIVTSIAVYSYFGLQERLAFLEQNQARTEQQINAASDWIKNFELPEQVQQTVERVRLLELKIVELETQLKLKGD